MYQSLSHAHLHGLAFTLYKTDIATWNGLTRFEVRWHVPRLACSSWLLSSLHATAMTHGAT